MPSRTTFSNRRRPTGFTLFLRRFPQNKVACVRLLVLVHVDTGTCDIALELQPRELSVTRKRGDAVIQRSVALISMAVAGKLLHDIDHLREMLCCKRQHFGPFYV